MTDSMFELTFKAMNTEVKVIANGTSDQTLLDRIRELFARSEQRFSRFIDSSELSVLNRDGELNPASEMMLDVLESSLRHFNATNGGFNPTVLDALELAGYSKSFELIGQNDTQQVAKSSTAVNLNEELEIDHTSQQVRTNTRLDLGGIVKGWTVDHAARLMRSKCLGWLIDAGGDISAGGIAPDSGGWAIGIDDPFSKRNLIDVIKIDDLAVATSSTVKRSWQAGRTRHHHIIDPQTGRSSSTNIASVSVIAANAETADVLAKSALIIGETEAAKLLSDHNAEARFIYNDGATTSTNLWPSILNDQDLPVFASERNLA